MGNMRAALVAFLLVAAAAGQHVHFEIPEVEQYVSSQLQEFGQYGVPVVQGRIVIANTLCSWTHYPGPSPTYWHHPSPRPTKPVRPPPANKCDYWLADIKHQGIAAFNPNPGDYTVFRNVKDFGAVGNGIADDTAAINEAISSGGRLSPAQGGSTTVTPAVV
jgi:glucan 1,3-beta-glucosidase